MSTGDKIIKCVMDIERLKAENISIDDVLEGEEFESEDSEKNLRMSRIVNLGKIQVRIGWLKTFTNTYLEEWGD